MLKNWFGKTLGQCPAALRSFSDRSDLWSVARLADMPDAADAPGGLPTQGLTAGTLVATDMGWVPVQNLRPGDMVVTFDNGLVPLRAVQVGELTTGGHCMPRSFWPLYVPKGALGNRQDMTLLSEQSVLIETDEGEALFGDPFLMVAASALDGYAGIERVQPAPIMRIRTLHFDAEQVVYANGMTLVHCPDRAPSRCAAPEGATHSGRAPAYQCLPQAQSAALIQAMRASAGGMSALPG